MAEECAVTNSGGTTATLAREFGWGRRFPEPVALVDHTDAARGYAGGAALPARRARQRRRPDGRGLDQPAELRAVQAPISLLRQSVCRPTVEWSRCIPAAPGLDRASFSDPEVAEDPRVLHQP